MAYRLIWRVSLTIIILLSLCLIPQTAAADLNTPSTLRIESVKIFRHYQDANDTLAIVRYNISYANETLQPYQPINETFVFNWTDSNGCDLGNVTAYPFHNLGYAAGIVSFYFEAGHTCGNTTSPAWGDLGNITAIGTDLFDSPPSDIWNITANDYTSYTAPADIREELRQHIISTALLLTVNWNDYYLDMGADSPVIDLVQHVSPDYTVLSVTGESYFTLSIDNLYACCPLLFSHQITEPERDDRTHTQAGASYLRDRNDDTQLEEFRKGVNEFTGNMGEMVMGNVITCILCIVIVAIWAIKFNKAQAGILASFPVIIFMVDQGFADLYIMLTLVMIAVILIAYKMLFRTGQG